MFISHKYRLIFIHIQKTGGNSISNLFNDLDDELIQELPITNSTKRLKHCFISDIQAIVSPEIFAEYTKFSIVRNPYERLFSWYSMFKYQKTDFGITPGKMPNADVLGDAVLAEVEPYLDSFENFLSMPNQGLLERFYYNQLDYLLINQVVAVDKVLRFENLSHDFNELAEQLNISAVLPHVNQSKVKRDYREVYSEKSQYIVAQRFQRDVDYFSYSF
jgi:Sulfotransferase family